MTVTLKDVDNQDLWATQIEPTRQKWSVRQSLTSSDRESGIHSLAFRTPSGIPKIGAASIRRD
jgi:hypothetical protein